MDRRKQPQSEEHKRKIALSNSITHTGMRHSEKTIEKIRQFHKTHPNKGMFKKGHKLGLGRKRPDMIGHNHGFKKGVVIPHKNNCACFRCKPKKGAELYNWKGGIENTRLLWRKRRAREMSASGSHTLKEWETLKAQYDWTCPCCKKKEPEIKLTIDHIIPLSKGGSHNIENIQPLCGGCNSKKHSRIIKYDLYI